MQDDFEVAQNEDDSDNDSDGDFDDEEEEVDEANEAEDDAYMQRLSREAAKLAVRFTWLSHLLNNSYQSTYNITATFSLISEDIPPPDLSCSRRLNNLEDISDVPCSRL